MATTIATARHANAYPRKRSISEKESPTFQVSIPTPKKIDFTSPSLPSPTTYSPRSIRKHPLHGRKSSLDKSVRRYTSRSSNMDSPSSPSLAAPLPPFLSVYDSNSSRSSFEVLNDAPQPFSSKNQPNDACFNPIDGPTFNLFHQPRNSTSTSASESTESSPTTTVSLDSCSMTDPSPAPSPQSPSSMNFAMDASRFTPLETTSPDSMLAIPRKASPPGKRGKNLKNLKNLAVNTSAAYNLGRGLSSAPLKPEPQKQSSAPNSPMFVKPPTPPKRRMGNISLTIMTPANPSNNGIVPQTPSIYRPGTLRHFQSSPSLPLFTSGLGPSGGMKLPSKAPVIARGFAEIPMEEEEEEEEQNFDIPQSQEDKPDSYPNGPIRIYESGVDLYYEPSAEVASRYHVIFNVASEVKNPFDVAAEARRLMPLPLSNNVGIISTPSENSASPTTPKATPITTNPSAEAFLPDLPLKRPEYIHIPWEHNTDIVPDLHRLVKVMDERVNQGKTVLVHCQCGVSRSASLIVAYGLYKNPDMSVQEAYNAVKKRSKWIGPNMSLIMQLQEFKNGLGREYQSVDAYGIRKATTMPLSSISDVFDNKIPSAPQTPRTEQHGSIIPLSPSAIGPFSAAPIESTSGSFWEAAFRRSWGSQQTNNNLAIPGISLVTDTPYVDPKGHIVPVVTVLHNEQTPVSQLSQPEPERFGVSEGTWRTPNFTRPLPFRTEFEEDTPMTDAPSLEPLLSPRSNEFHMSSVVPPLQAQSFDHFNILSPMTTEFQLSTPPKAPSSPPEPRRDAPPPPPERQMESLDSIFSPTSTTFPSILPLPLVAPVQDQTVDLSSFRPTQRIDSLIPQLSPVPITPQKEMRRLRPKFSAPNLSQRLQLQKMQDDVASSLPKRPAEAEEALLSPRATSFVINPFHNLPVSITEDPVGETKSDGFEPVESPTTPSSTGSDPRSPAQFMLSPITRNIWGMI